MAFEVSCYNCKYRNGDTCSRAVSKNSINNMHTNSCSLFEIELPVAHIVELTESQEAIHKTLESLRNLLIEKNRRYGNSALEPVGIFNKLDSTSGILVRLDDKVSRIKNSEALRKNDVADIMGYLTLLCVSNGWTNFDELID